MEKRRGAGMELIPGCNVKPHHPPDPRAKATVIVMNQTAARKAGRIPFISAAIAGTYRIPLLVPLSTRLAFSRLSSPTLHLLG